VDSDKKRSDEYWMGVRDSLRMVDSFIKWARRNEDRAKALDDFIHDGLVAAAKRCESCLKDDLGLTFAEGEAPGEESTEMEHVPSGYEMGHTMEVPSEPSEVPIEPESDPVSIDTVGRLEEEEIEDLSMEGPPRDFSSDFELVEPTDLVVDPSKTDDEITSTPEPETIDEVSEDEDRKPSFTWADYEKAVAPTKKDPELVEEDTEFPPPLETESTEELPESTSVPEPPELPDDDFESRTTQEDATDTSEPITEPPAPPPPPESDEDEEERRRRARRLFFGD